MPRGTREGQVMDEVLAGLLRSEEPSVRWRVRTGVLGEADDTRPVRALRDEVRRSPRVRTIIKAAEGMHPYAKWKGSHWALLSLAGLGYPAGDSELFSLRDAVLEHWLAPRYMKDVDVSRATKAAAQAGVVRIAGRSRRCGSQQGGALLAIVRLGIDDGRGATLAGRLREWQWPDGGWNCDVSPVAAMSSVNETLLPMRGLKSYADASGDTSAADTARGAAEVLLQRRLAWRRSSAEPIAPDVMKTHHPVYWHYDFLAGLIGLMELGLLADPRCGDALDYLQSQRRPDGGWGADAKYWRISDDGSNIESVSWGPISRQASNEWVTCEALTVLAATGRL